MNWDENGHWSNNLALLPLIRVFDIVLDTSVRQCPNKFGIALTYSYLCGMYDIIEVFNRYLAEYGSVDIAESEFKKNLHEDADLRADYKQWCDEVGCTEKRGFLDYCDEYLDSQNDVWNALNDYDDE